jgi:hypothetical protein
MYPAAGAIDAWLARGGGADGENVDPVIELWIAPKSSLSRSSELGEFVRLLKFGYKVSHGL